MYGAVFNQDCENIDSALFCFQKETQKKLKYLGVESPPYSGTSYVGVEYCQMEENETKAEFKKRVASYLIEFNDWLKNKHPDIALEKVACETHSEAWYDG